MTIFSNLNNRHKVVLFFTLLATGTGLLLNATAKESSGIALLGIAVAWLVGSDSLTVHWLVFGLGFVLMFAPSVFYWNDLQGARKSYETKVAAFEQAIPELAKQYEYKKFDVNPETGARMGWNGSMWVLLASGNSTQNIGDEWNGDHWISEPNTPKWLSDAVHAGVDVDAVPDWRKPPYFPPAHFSLSDSLLSGSIVELPGLILLGIALFTIFRLSRSRADATRIGEEERASK